MTHTIRRGDNQKLKMLYLVKILTEESDETHPLTMTEIITKLAAYGVNANRKTLYQDFEELRHFGLDLISSKEKGNYYYYLGSREFELPELKLLVDSVQASRFISDRKSKLLIQKLESLASKYQAKRLHRQVTISGRIKTMNESIYYNVDTIHEAILDDFQITFQYYQWNTKKEMQLRRDGHTYQVSPWALMWDNENYYLIAYDATAQKIKHYRVDKMLRITTTTEHRLGKDHFHQFNLPRYSNCLFGMYGGQETTVSLKAHNSIVGVLVDRFGKELPIYPLDDEYFQTTITVAISPQFIGWLLSLSPALTVTAPKALLAQLQDIIKNLSKQYGQS